MKKLISIYWIPLVLIISLNLYQGITYYIAKLTPFNETVVGGNVDNYISFQPAWVVFYLLWHPLLILVPCFFYKFSKKSFYLYFTTVFLIDTVAFLIFFFYPTILVRPEFEVTGLFTWALNLVYLGDTPAVNCLPSIHCTTCFLFIFCSIVNKVIPKIWKYACILVASLIIVSTVFVKQHAVIDIIGSLVVSSTLFIVVYKYKIHEKIYAKIEKEKDH